MRGVVVNIEIFITQEANGRKWSTEYGQPWIRKGWFPVISV